MFVEVGFGQKPTENIQLDSIIEHQNKYIEIYGLNQIVADTLSPYFFTALSYYPELSLTSIKVKYKNIRTTMACRPTPNFIFRKKDKRHYKILVDNKKKDNNGMLFFELPVNAKIGVFGHELAHVVDYRDKSNFEIIKFGLEYLNNGKRRETEEYIDYLTVSHGLGYQLNDFAEYVFNESNVSKEYLDYKKRFYFQPFQIRRMLRAKSTYKENQVSKTKRFKLKK